MARYANRGVANIGPGLPHTLTVQYIKAILPAIGQVIVGDLVPLFADRSAASSFAEIEIGEDFTDNLVGSVALTAVCWSWSWGGGVVGCLEGEVVGV